MTPNSPTASSEWLTRKKLIDPRLQSAGWKVVPHDEEKPLTAYHGCAIEEYPTDSGPADYALCWNERIIGIVEAKKLTLGPQNVLTQAERYSKGCGKNPFNFRGFRVPFLYSTNGEIIWHHDIRHELSRSRQIRHFHNPGALEEKLGGNFDDACNQLLKTPNIHPLIRPYQQEANEAVENAINHQKRQMLLAMATGTGKTFTMVNQIYRLMKSGVARRILFLVDRRALAAQAVRAFASFEAEPGYKFNQLYDVFSQRFFREDFDDDNPFDPKVLPAQYLLNPQPGQAFVYVCTIQRMAVNLFGRNALVDKEDDEIEDDAGQIDIPIHAFQFIVADECHRGYTGKELAIWRETLDHFDAIKVGLTATPAAHTTTYFKELVYRYEYERAVREGYLVDYDVVNIHSHVRLNGVFLDEGETVDVINPETGSKQLDILEAERQYDSTKIEQEVTVPDSNRKILEEIRKYAELHEQNYGNFPKILVFAVNDLPHTSHADQLVDTARDVFGRGESFVQKITGRADRPLQRIREFRNRQQPAVVVTVDMLSTGVDIPDLEFIVFLRPVKSRILFEQMLGRGTRKGLNIPAKSKFTVFDCFNGTLMEYFRKATAITAEMVLSEPRTIVQIIEDIWQNRDRDYNIRCLVKRLQRVDKEMSAEARQQFAEWIPDGDMHRFARDLPGRLEEDFTGTMALLRNEDFQKLLQHYSRKQRTFIVAIATEDEVTSAPMGLDEKPEDYLAAFARFIREEKDHIEALHILIDRPREWSPLTLQKLRKTLLTTPGHFTEAKLQKAHELHYKKALVDIISMVKHAARETEPLLTAQERVASALRDLQRGRLFTGEQRDWLGYIGEHLACNLSIDMEDLENQPVFSKRGGLGKAKRVFGENLEGLIRELNERIAA